MPLHDAHSGRQIGELHAETHVPLKWPDVRSYSAGEPPHAADAEEFTREQCDTMVIEEKSAYPHPSMPAKFALLLLPPFAFCSSRCMKYCSLEVFLTGTVKESQGYRDMLQA